MHIVTSIQQAKKKDNRVNIFLDNDFWLGMDKNDLIFFGLFRNQEITPEKKKEIEESVGFNRVLEKAINYTLVRPRSEREMHEYLTFKRGLAPQEADKIIERLKGKDCIDDKKFTEWYVDNRLNFGVHGENKIYAELQKKGVSSSIAREVLKEKINSETEDDTIEKIKEFAEKSLRTIKATSDFEKTQKLTQKLLARGFKYSDIKKALA